MGGDSVTVVARADKELVGGGDDVNAINRPVRLRKSVKRLVDSVDTNAVKEFRIEKGRGTELRDITNVAYNLSRKRNENTIKVLHSILFSRRAKASEIRNHVLRFSGFVWLDNEDEEKKKIRAKLEKCVKDKLVEVCRILDISVSKAKAKKEEIITKLMGFLEAPYNAKISLVAINHQEQSREGKKRKRDTESTPPKLSSKVIRSCELFEAKEIGKMKITKSEQGKSKPNQADNPKKSANKEAIGKGKKLDKGKNKAVQEISYPCDLDIQQAICEILKEVDMEKTSMSDVIRKLGEQLQMDVTPRKLSLKLMIKDQIAKLGLGDDDDE